MVYRVWSDSRAGGELGSAAGQLVVGVEGQDLYFVCTLLLSCFFSGLLYLPYKQLIHLLTLRSMFVSGIWILGEKPP